MKRRTPTADTVHPTADTVQDEPWPMLLEYLCKPENVARLTVELAQLRAALRAAEDEIARLYEANSERDKHNRRAQWKKERQKAELDATIEVLLATSHKKRGVLKAALGEMKNPPSYKTALNWRKGR